MTSNTLSDRNKGFIRSVERGAPLLMIAALALTHALDGLGAVFYGVLVGSVVGVLNWRAIIWLAHKTTQGEQRSHEGDSDDHLGVSPAISNYGVVARSGRAVRSQFRELSRQLAAACDSGGNRRRDTRRLHPNRPVAAGVFAIEASSLRRNLWSERRGFYLYHLPARDLRGSRSAVLPIE